MQKFTVTDDNDGARLDKWAKRELPDVPHSMVQRMLRKGEMKLNGKRAEANIRLKIGDEIGIKSNLLGDWETKDKKQEYLRKKAAEKSENNAPKLAVEFNRLIIFENNDYIVINKPSGLATQGGTGIKVSVDDMIGAISERYKLVHRLDKDTSGVLVIAKKNYCRQQIC